MKSESRRYGFAGSTTQAGRATAAAPARQLNPARRLPTARLDTPLQPSAPAANTLADARATAEREALSIMKVRVAEDLVVTNKCVLVHFVFLLLSCVIN